MGKRHRQHYRDIKTLCESEAFRARVTLIVAHDEIEAWLLADEGLCTWLEVKPASTCDSIQHPSETLERLLKKKKQELRWNTRSYDDVLDHVDGSGDKLSASMREALTRLRALPCAQPTPDSPPAA